MAFSGRNLSVFLVVLVGFGAAVTLLGNALLRHDAGTPAVTQPPQGRALYDAHCAVCHGLSGKGDGPGAKVVRQPMRDFSDATVMRAVDDRFLIDIIKKGGSQFGRSNAMPAWSMKLSEEEVRAIVAYIRSLPPKNPPIPPGRKDQP